jgi:Fe-S cluster assembly scaffold protein SufB
MHSMVYGEFKRHLGKAGLSIKELAKLLRHHPNSFSNYKAKGEVPDHLAVIVALMGEMADNGLDFKTILARLNLTPQKPRGGSKNTPFSGTRKG